MLQISRKPKESKRSAERNIPKLLFGFLLFCVLSGSAMFHSTEAEAAGAAISVTTKSNKVTEGDTVYVVITVSSMEDIKGFEGYFSYDNRVLQFVTGGSVVHGNDDEFQISDMERSSSATRIKYSVKFRARKKGQTTIMLKQPYNVVADDDTSTKMSVSYNALDIVVEKDKGSEQQNPNQAAETPLPKSSTEPGKKASDNKGQKAAATKKPKKPSPSPSASTAPKNAAKKDKTGIGTNLDIDVIEITDDSQIPPGFLETEFDIDGRTVTAYALSGNTDSDYLLLYGKAKNQKKEDETETKAEAMFYLYDKSSGTLMPYDSIRYLYRSMNAKDLLGDSSQRTIQSLKYVIGIMGVFCALMLLLAIAFRIRYSNRR